MEAFWRLIESEILQRVYLNSPLWRWALAVLSFFLVMAVGIGLRRIFRGRKGTGAVHYVFAVLGQTSRVATMLIAVGLSARWLLVHPYILKAEQVCLVLGVSFQVGRFLIGIIQAFAEEQVQKRDIISPEALSSVGILRILAQGVAWSLVILLALSNLGVDISTLVASLGVGGIAVALAAQNILGDLFASLTIVLDKPFQVGDFVVVGAQRGTIKAIGLKTTRINSLDGEELVLGNNDILNSRIQNFKRMQERRVVFRFGVTYDTPSTQLEQIPEVCRRVMEGLESVRFDRAHFAAFGASSLDFEVVYYVEGNDYLLYMDRQQSINLGLVRELESMDVSFAFPTQTLHVASMPSMTS